VILLDKEKDVSFVIAFLFSLHIEIFREYFVIHLTNRRCLFRGARFFSFSITEIFREHLLLPDKEKDVPGSGDMLLVHGDVLVAHRLQLVRRLQAQRRPTG
jgi:hypothetical protein